MSKLLNRSLRRLLVYAALVLIFSMPVYYVAISMLWQYEMDEHHVILTPEAGREDSFLIIGAVTLLTVLFFILLLGGFILLNRRISRQLWQPFYHTLSQIRNFDLHRQRTVAFRQTDITEFAELNQSLNKLIAGSIAAYDQQKEFADNASHELQTPLAIIQSKLELLSQSQSLTNDQYTIIEDALQALTRVNRINKNLLLLTRIENSQFMEKERIILSDLLKNSLPPFAHFFDSKQLTLQTDILPGVAVEGNRILIEILLNNLVTNAIRHSLPHSPVLIRLSGRELAITNSGTAALAPERLFKRFASASFQTPGTGLGLALVRQICERYGWSVHYSFREGNHVFSLHF